VSAELPDNLVARENLRLAHERHLSALSDLLSGGLFVDDTDVKGEPERALLLVAGALLKAVTVATFAASDGEDMGVQGGGWVAHSSSLSRNEQHDALCGIVSLLRNGPRVLERLREDGEFRMSSDRIESIEDARETLTRLAGEQELARDEGSVEP
jgi:hypothetical protein